jgi:hypothetical protein
VFLNCMNIRRWGDFLKTLFTNFTFNCIMLRESVLIVKMHCFVVFVSVYFEDFISSPECLKEQIFSRIL